MRISDWSSDVCSSDLFDHPIPFREIDHYYESALRKDDGSTNRGAFGRAVRSIPDHEFEAILAVGFASLLTSGSATRDDSFPGMAEGDASFERRVEERLNSRPFRDAAFAKLVRDAYDATCALTGRSEEHTSELQSLMGSSYASV